MHELFFIIYLIATTPILLAIVVVVVAVILVAVIDKYNPETAQKILGGQIWQGMTAEQLSYAVGKPEAVDKIVTKRTSKEVWKYFQQTATRFNLRVTVQDGVVVGWQMK
ncbi:MAG: hypothetical protein QOH67_1077 [Hyphomicrobiales bacterium]|nr:hypothetical protein [Hyphomicrobiales bacterium]